MGNLKAVTLFIVGLGLIAYQAGILTAAGVYLIVWANDMVSWKQ